MNAKERKEYIAQGHTGKGWLPLIQELDYALGKIDRNYEIVQIKEKFGGLRFYYELRQSFISRYPFFWRTPLYGMVERYRKRKRGKMNRLVNKAELKSYLTCETCGSTTNVTTEGSWIKTLCSKCRNNE